MVYRHQIIKETTFDNQFSITVYLGAKRNVLKNGICPILILYQKFIFTNITVVKTNRFYTSTIIVI